MNKSPKTLPPLIENVWQKYLQMIETWTSGYENTNMHHATVFHYFESGTQASDTLNRSQFYKIVAKCGHREHKE